MHSKSDALGEVATYFGLTLGLSHYVNWGPLATRVGGDETLAGSRGQPGY